MLKQILDEKIKQINDVHPVDAMLESKGLSLALDNDPEIEMVLPIIAKGEEEYDDYRFILKQLKKRNNVAFKKIVNLD